MGEILTPSVKDRLRYHAECLAEERYPVVFCVRCGSTHIDQNFLTELRCYDCGNTLAWDGSKFGINRYAADATDPGRFTDAASAFSRNVAEVRRHADMIIGMADLKTVKGGL